MNSHIAIAIAISTGMAVGIGASIPQEIRNTNHTKTTETPVEQPIEVVLATPKVTPTPKPISEYTAQEFVNFYDNFNYTNVNIIKEKPYVFDHTEADKQVQKLAEEKGYKLRYEANTDNLVWVDGFQLQKEAAESWTKMKNSAANEGVYMGLISGYRSVATQRSIFLNVFANQYTKDQITQGIADERINQILLTRSIPGYSKHHTGYTIDITDSSIGQNFTKIVGTKTHEWMTKNNFENARKFGFIPSYPEGAVNMGPRPEAWEYVWVGNITYEPPKG